MRACEWNEFLNTAIIPKIFPVSAHIAIWTLPKKLLLMGSSAYGEELPPKEFMEIVDEAAARGDQIIVGEAHGACRAFQRYLHRIGYTNVVVGHAKTIRFNLGGWQTRKFGESVPERESALIRECDYALIVWVDSSSVIAKNIDYLRRLRKPTFIYEASRRPGKSRFYAL